MKIGRVTAVVAAGFLGTAAQAQDAGPAEAPSASDGHALEIGVRTGYAFALGKATGDGTRTIDYSMSDLTSGQIPLQLDVLYRIDRFAVGGYFSFGIVPLHKDYACGSSADGCSGNDLRVGVEGQFHPLVNHDQVDPWIGLGIGYEIFHLSASAGGQTTSLNFTGFEFANLAVGADFRVSRQFSLGPLVGATFGEYSGASVSFGGSSFSADIPDKALHLWLNVGLRGTFNLPIH